MVKLSFYFLIIIQLVTTGMSPGESLSKNEIERTELISEVYHPMTGQQKRKTERSLAQLYHVLLPSSFYSQVHHYRLSVNPKKDIYLLHCSLRI